MVGILLLKADDCPASPPALPTPWPLRHDQTAGGCTMNDWLAASDLLAWKPVATALLMPPVPLLLLAALAALAGWRRARGWCTLLALLALAGLWASQSVAVGSWLQARLLPVPPALAGDALRQLQRQLAAGGRPVVVVLGGGREPALPEFDGAPDLSEPARQRLRHGLWLATQLQDAPVLFSGGTGHAGRPGAAEAEVAARVARRDHGRTLRWLESTSRDTRENASHSVRLLRGAAVTHLVLVTHGWHMPRAHRAFDAALSSALPEVRLVLAPMGLAEPDMPAWARWLPSHQGHQRVYQVWREWLGWQFGA
jgi:uncharacterized SAM-binding protein YcdF (DUF218 family)